MHQKEYLYAVPTVLSTGIDAYSVFKYAVFVYSVPTHARHPEANRMKARRQGLILELIDREPLHSQEEMRRRLLQRGCEATQATISRDIKELGLVKRAGDGAYQRQGVDVASPELALNAL